MFNEKLLPASADKHTKVLLLLVVMTMKCIGHWHRLVVMCFWLWSQMLSLQTSLPWDTWQELRTESKKSSESILSVLLETKVGATHLQHFTKNKMTGTHNLK